MLIQTVIVLEQLCSEVRLYFQATGTSPPSDVQPQWVRGEGFHVGFPQSPFGLAEEE